MKYYTLSSCYSDGKKIFKSLKLLFLASNKLKGI